MNAIPSLFASQAKRQACISTIDCIPAMVVVPFIVFGLCVEDGDELDTVCVNHYFASLGKIYGDASTDVALHLADAPFGTIGVRNERPRDEKGCKRVHV